MTRRISPSLLPEVKTSHFPMCSSAPPSDSSSLRSVVVDPEASASMALNGRPRLYPIETRNCSLVRPAMTGMAYLKRTARPGSPGRAELDRIHSVLGCGHLLLCEDGVAFLPIKLSRLILKFL